MTLGIVTSQAVPLEQMPASQASAQPTVPQRLLQVLLSACGLTRCPSCRSALRAAIDSSPRSPSVKVHPSLVRCVAVPIRACTPSPCQLALLLHLIGQHHCSHLASLHLRTSSHCCHGAGACMLSFPGKWVCVPGTAYSLALGHCRCLDEGLETHPWTLMGIV